MAKQKRKVTEMTEKKNKKLKKVSVKEILLAPEDMPGPKQAHPEVGARGVVSASARFPAGRGGSWGLYCSGRSRGWNVTCGHTQCLLEATVRQIRGSAHFSFEHHDRLSSATEPPERCSGCHAAKGI